MTLGRIIFNNARQRLLSTALTGLSVAVGVALIVAILTIKLVSQERLRVGYSGFDMVVGARGSSLQLVLNVVYHLDTSPGNIPFSLYEKLGKDPRVKMLVPFAVGDNYQGFRIVGTSDIFLRDFEPQPHQSFELASGRIFKFEESELLEAMKDAMDRGSHEKTDGKDDHHHDAGHCEAVLGSTAADVTGLKIGNTFVATHGVQQNSEGEKHQESPWTVVGILKPTETPADRAIYINLDSFYHIEGHVIEEKHSSKSDSTASAEPEPGQISALALKTRSPIAVWSLRREINNGDEAQAAVPSEEIRKLLTITGNVDRILLIQAVLIVIVSAMGTALAMFNSMNDRRRDIAVMRALGARRQTIMAIIVGEAVLIAGLGAGLGLILGQVVVQASASMIQAAVGFSIPAWTFHGFEVVVLIGMLMLGVLAGIGPALMAYRTNVAMSLSSNP